MEQSRSRGISYERNIMTETNCFGTNIMRGVLQHLEETFRYLKRGYKSLKSQGYLFNLTTPNSGSLYYEAHETLPWLNYQKTHFYMPSVKTLTNILETYGYEIAEI